MKDPFPFPAIPGLSRAVQPFADRYAMATLPLHVHEVLVAALFYTFIQTVVSPVLSRRFFPRHYPAGSRGKKANWDAHVVSLVQATLINGLALWVMWDEAGERSAMDWQQRVWGYTGANGFVQAMAAGYFVWDLVTTVAYIDVFGLGLLAHAVSALAVYSFGFRPFLNYYSPVFILYELSTPFLNIHWFFDKLGMTGSRAQLYNGIALLFTFFSCRLIWGTWQSAVVYRDMWLAVHNAPDAGYVAAAHNNGTKYADPDLNPMAFVTEAVPVPAWLALIYVASNMVLNALNWFWFVKMIAAVRKRFEPAKGNKATLVAGKPEQVAIVERDGVATTTATGEKVVPRHRRQRSLEDLIPVPDSEELREGTIQ